MKMHFAYAVPRVIRNAARKAATIGLLVGLSLTFGVSSAQGEETGSPGFAGWAAGWVAKGKAQEERSDVGGALLSFTNAIRVDPSYGPGWLGLGGVRERLGESDEAEMLYTRAARIPSVAAEALARRGALRRAKGRLDEAAEDLEQSVALDPTVRARLLALADWYVSRALWPAALALFRRLEFTVEGEANSADRAEIRMKVQALEFLAGPTDPVVSGHQSSNPIRRSLAKLAAKPSGRGASQQLLRKH